MGKQFNIIIVGGGIAGLATVGTNPIDPLPIFFDADLRKGDRPPRSKPQNYCSRTVISQPRNRRHNLPPTQRLQNRRADVGSRQNLEGKGFNGR
jgi:hypothetical protein